MALTYCGSTAFRRELERRVASYFEAENRSRHGTARMHAKTVILLGWLAASYVGMVCFATTWWQAVPLAVSMALAMAGVGFNIQHDGSHGAYSRHAPSTRRRRCRSTCWG
jgi:linoleoyl-CoA desaturase